jgi:hypothetical protein
MVAQWQPVASSSRSRSTRRLQAARWCRLKPDDPIYRSIWKGCQIAPFLARPSHGPLVYLILQDNRLPRRKVQDGSHIACTRDAVRRNVHLAPRRGDGAPGRRPGAESRPRGASLRRCDLSRGHRPTGSPADQPRRMERAHRVPTGSGDRGIGLWQARSGHLAASAARCPGWECDPASASAVSARGAERRQFFRSTCRAAPAWTYGLTRGRVGGGRLMGAAAGYRAAGGP